MSDLVWCLVCYEQQSFNWAITLSQSPITKYLSSNKLILILCLVAFKMLSLKNPTHVDFHELTSNMDRDFIGKLYPGILTICQRALRLPLKKLKRDDFEHDLKEIK